MRFVLALVMVTGALGCDEHPFWGTSTTNPPSQEECAIRDGHTWIRGEATILITAWGFMPVAAGCVPNLPNTFCGEVEDCCNWGSTDGVGDPFPCVGLLPEGPSGPPTGGVPGGPEVVEDPVEEAPYVPPPPDMDGDQVPDDEDNCPDIHNPFQEDRDVDMVGDACDNCPDVENQQQLDFNDDGAGDACAPMHTLAALGPDEGRDTPPKFSDLLFSEMAYTGWAPGVHPLEIILDILRGDLDSLFEDGPVGANRMVIRSEQLDTVEDILERFSDWESQAGKVAAMVFGRHYEAWAVRAYGHSPRHEAWGRERAVVVCRKELRVQRYTRNFENPEPLQWQGQPQGNEDQGPVYNRNRRWDFGCFAVNDPDTNTFLPPLAEEFKSTSSPDRWQYNNWLHTKYVEQCQDYRFHLAKMYYDEFPAEFMNIRDVHDRMSRSKSWGRPYLTYRMHDVSPAWEKVMRDCELGHMMDDGVWSQARTAAAHSIGDFHNMFTYVGTRPIWYQPPDDPANCDGTVLYIARRGCVDPGTFDPNTGLCLPGNGLFARQAGIYTTCSVRRPDGHPHMTPMKFLGAESGWLGNPRYLTNSMWNVQNVVCPASTMNESTREVNTRIIALDGAQRVLPLNFPEFSLQMARLYQWGHPMRFSLDPKGFMPSWAEPGFHISVDRELLQLFVQGVDSEGIDADEALDLCKD
jgi:hypothetical protein